MNTIGTFYRAKAMDTPFEVVQSHFELNTMHNIKLTQMVVPKLKKGFAQILVCLATLAMTARQNYALQCATKAGYKLFLDAMRIELKDDIRVMTIHPPSVNTGIFAKAGDYRDVNQYVDPIHVAKAMWFMLDQIPEISIPELVLENRS